MKASQTALIISAIIIISGVSGGIFLLQSSEAKGKSILVVSTTTSLYDTGILDRVEDLFEEEEEIDVRFISVGTGLAIEHAKRGDADMILVHAPTQEKQFLSDGYGVCRKIIAYNYFGIVGPEQDPAQVKEMAPKEALQLIMETGSIEQALWISRGDNSGTHSKEKSLWNEAGCSHPSLLDEEWYRESGTGMGKTLQITDELDGYTLTDMGTYLKYKSEGLIDLEVLVGTGEELINVYSAIAIDPDINPNANFDSSISFIEYLISEEGQEIFYEYGVEEYEINLFNPAVKKLTEGTSQEAKWIQNFAYIDESECPLKYRHGQDQLY